MANKSSVPRVPKSRPQPTISGMDGQQMHNEILLGLPRKECDVLFPDLEYVQMRTHDALHEAGQPITHGYFVNERGFHRIASSRRFEHKSQPGRSTGCRQRFQN